MNDPSGIYPFDDQAPDDARLFRQDPLHPPQARMPALVGADSIHFRRQKSVDQFWDDWFEGQGQSLDDLFEQRLATAWRIVREIAVARGLLSGAKQRLSDVTRVSPSPWEAPFHFFSRRSDDPVVNAICEERKLPLLPPDIAARHPDGHVDQGYDPAQDDSLLDYIKLTEHVATRRLFIPRSRSGRLGCAGLFDPNIARSAWPTPTEIMHFEDLLVERTFGKMVSTQMEEGDEGASAMLRVDFDLHPHEIAQVMAMARAHSLQATGLNDPETFFAMEIAKMSALQRRQTQREDFRGAAQTSRDMLRLTAARETNDGDEDYDAVVEAEMAREKKRLPKPESDGMLGEDDSN